MRWASLLAGATMLACASARGGGQANDLGASGSGLSRREVDSLRLEKPFLDKHTYTNRNYEFTGSTMVRSDNVRLTQDLPDQRGFITSRAGSLPENFQVEFDFRIHGQGATLYGDGMSVWMLPSQVSAEGSMFGMPDRTVGTGVLFDTYKNNRPGKTFPYVMLMHGDGVTPYDHDHDGLANEIAGCSARGLHNAKDVSKARLTYVKDRFVSLELNYRGQNRWDKCFETADTGSLTPRFLAFSAQTGELSESHDIQAVHVFELLKVPTSYAEVDYYMNGNEHAIQRATRGASGSSSSFGSWLWFFFKIAFAGGVVFAAYSAFAVYRSKSRRYGRSDLPMY